MNSKSTNQYGRFPVPLGRIAAIQVLATSCLVVFNLLPLLVVFFALGVNLGDFTFVSDFSNIAFGVFVGGMVIDMGMFVYAMGDAKRSASNRSSVQAGAAKMTVGCSEMCAKAFRARARVPN